MKTEYLSELRLLLDKYQMSNTEKDDIIDDYSEMYDNWIEYGMGEEEVEVKTKIQENDTDKPQVEPFKPIEETKKKPIEKPVEKVIFTKYADGFATAFGGSTMYRNRIETYKKEGFSEKEAKEYCTRKDKDIKYNESMGHKYYDYDKVNLLEFLNSKFK